MVEVSKQSMTGYREIAPLRRGNTLIEKISPKRNSPVNAKQTDVRTGGF